MKRALVASVVLFAVLAAAVAAVALVAESSTRVEAACRCPLIYAPVVCDHGREYPNQCVADCHHAQNCVPTGGF